MVSRVERDAGSRCCSLIQRNPLRGATRRDLALR